MPEALPAWAKKQFADDAPCKMGTEICHFFLTFGPHTNTPLVVDAAKTETIDAVVENTAVRAKIDLLDAHLLLPSNKDIQARKIQEQFVKIVFTLTSGKK